MRAAMRDSMAEGGPERSDRADGTRQSDVRATKPWLALGGAIVTVSVFVIAQGLSYPLLSFILERQGTSPALIGLSAAMTPLGIIVSAPFIPPLAKRFGPGATALACAGLAAMLFALIGWSQDLAAWFTAVSCRCSRTGTSSVALH